MGAPRKGKLFQGLGEFAWGEQGLLVVSLPGAGLAVARRHRALRARPASCLTGQRVRFMLVAIEAHRGGRSPGARDLMAWLALEASTTSGEVLDRMPLRFASASGVP